MNVFDSQWWNQFLAIAKPYWYLNEEGERTVLQLLWSWSILTTIVLLLLFTNSISASISYVNRDLIYVLEQKDFLRFFFLLLIYISLFILLTPLGAVSGYLRKKLALDWYQWLTNSIIDKYFHNRSYYQINFQSDIENPDQRIAQEIEPVTSRSLEIFLVCLEKIIEMIVFIWILWSISKIMAVALIAYTIFGNIVAIFLSQELANINSDKLEDEADYRYYLTHVRDNAESIAFFQGEAKESSLLKQKFANLISNSERLIGWQRNLQLFNNGYQYFILIFPFLTVAPLYFFDRIELGEVSQASIACAEFAGALSVIVYQFSSFGSFTTLINRLAAFLDALAAVKTQVSNTTIDTVLEDRLALENVTLQTPNYERVLIQDLSLSVEPGTGLLIVGSSGSGKSSLLRMIAGLWNAGTGRLVRPNLEEILFLPQRPYMILGTLREQLLYPNINRQISDEEFQQVLQQVNLQDLLTRVGGFDAKVYWENILSLGEQQRLAFARILVTRPRYIILDEATSALDLRNEDNLYQQLQQTETTFISVGHRQSLLNYHQWVLELSEDSHWRLMPTQDYQGREYGGFQE
ncbi:MAG: ATP-binding cassette domain-containing protein [Cyanomargarita calcarea GSE-NOS-MK-12-04C]|jgi:putative ATP-binding cassette transporter|uniref:ATP-binding cassette domain-containing protein n=1 Tax=Cyanomargarita calcarea GSE-NOS-MK-12-04C TaxID=2839659 RepID=A0A951UUI3_9CYAN|nr:ATP-binding cassette domain-containing protein [Cyanomargarita calcarea GSE-NOS-MK-12-04C]